MDIDLDPGIFCEQVAVSFSCFYCFFFSENRMAVKIINFLQEDVVPVIVDIISIGFRYKVIFETPEYAILSSVHRSKTSIVIQKFYKTKNAYNAMLITPVNFGVSTLSIYDYFILYRDDEQNLYIFLSTTYVNSLILYRSHFNVKEFTNKKLTTIRDLISLNKVDKFIWNIQCRNRVTNGVFDCILVSNNYLYDTQIICVENAALSPFKWDVTVSYKYYNVYYDEINVWGPELLLRINEKYLAVINMDGDNRGVALYNRFMQAYVADFYNFGESDDEYHIDFAFTCFFSSDFQMMQILGVDTTENENLLLTFLDIKTAKVVIKNPWKYIGQTFGLSVTFMNKKSIDMNFSIRSLNEMLIDQSKTKSPFVTLMEAILVTMSLLIFGALGVLIKVIRDKGSEYMETRTLMTETHNTRVDGLMSPSRRVTSRRFNMGDV